MYLQGLLAPLSALANFLIRHSKVQKLHISETSAQERRRILTQTPQLLLPDLMELHGPIHFVQSFLRIIQTSNSLSTMSIFLSPDGLHPRSLDRLLTYPACAKVERLEVRFKDVVSTFITFQSRAHAGLPAIRQLTLTHCSDAFIFTEQSLVRQSFTLSHLINPKQAGLVPSIAQFPALSIIHIIDNSFEDRPSSLALFARLIRESGQLAKVSIFYNFEPY